MTLLNGSRVVTLGRFNSLRSRAEKIKLGPHEVWVAHLSDIIASKRAAGRDRDKAVLEILEKTLNEKNQSTKKT